MSDADEVRALLRRHLEWTRGHPSLVFLAAWSPDDLDDLVERVALYAGRAGREIRQFDRWEVGRERAALDGALPAGGLSEPDGITVLRLPWRDESQRVRLLALLNELRFRIGGPGSGALIVAGPPAMRAEAAGQAADLWSVRSFAPVAERADLPRGLREPSTGPERSADTDSDRLIFAGLRVAGEDRSGRDGSPACWDVPPGWRETTWARHAG